MINKILPTRPRFGFGHLARALPLARRASSLSLFHSLSLQLVDVVRTERVVPKDNPPFMNTVFQGPAIHDRRRVLLYHTCTLRTGNTMTRRVRFRDLLPAGWDAPPPDPIFSPDEKGQEPKLLHSIFSPKAAGGATRFLAQIQPQQRKNSVPSLAESSSPPQEENSTQEPQKQAVGMVVSPSSAEDEDGHYYDSDYHDHSSSSGWWPKESPRSDMPAVQNKNDLMTPQKKARKDRASQKHQQHAGGDPSFRSKQRNTIRKQQSPASFGDVSEILVSPSNNTALSSLAVSPSSLDLSTF